MKKTVWMSSRFTLPEDRSESDLVDSFFDDEYGDVVSKDGKRKVRRLVINGEHYYLKIDEKMNLGESLKFIWRNKSIISRVGREKKIIKLCAEANLEVMEVVVFSERKVFGFPVQGVMLVKEVVGEEFYKTFPNADAATRMKLARQYGLISGLANKNGIDSPIRARDMIITSVEDANITLIDREHGKPRAIRMNSRRTKRFLSRIFKYNESVIGKFSLSEVEQFMLGYCQVRPDYEKCADDFMRRYIQ